MKKNHKLLLLTIIAALSTTPLLHADWRSTLPDISGTMANLWGTKINDLFTQPQQPASTSVPKIITFDPYEAHNYINQLCASMKNALYAHVGYADLVTLKKRIHDNMHQAEYNQRNYSYSEKRYSKDKIDQLVSSAILEYIQNTAYHYTYSRTYDKTIAARVAESMHNNALAIITQNRIIDFRRLVPFVGKALERAVNDMLKNNNQYYQTTQYNYTPAKPSAPEYNQYNHSSNQQRPTPNNIHHSTQQATKPSSKPTQNLTQKPNSSSQKLYTSTECVVCLEDFGGPIERIYLKPCGHDMCKACAFDWFFGATQKTECPQCRTSVNLHQLQNDII